MQDMHGKSNMLVCLNNFASQGILVWNEAVVLLYWITEFIWVPGVSLGIASAANITQNSMAIHWGCVLSRGIYGITWHDDGFHLWCTNLVIICLNNKIKWLIVRQTWYWIGYRLKILLNAWMIIDTMIEGFIIMRWWSDSFALWRYRWALPLQLVILNYLAERGRFLLINELGFLGFSAKGGCNCLLMCFYFTLITISWQIFWH